MAECLHLGLATMDNSVTTAATMKFYQSKCLSSRALKYHKLHVEGNLKVAFVLPRVKHFQRMHNVKKKNGEI